MISLVSATNTKIQIKTIPNHKVQVAVADGTMIDFSVIQKFEATSNEYGDVSFELVSNKPKINLYVYVKKDNENVINEKYLGLSIGEPIYLELAPAWFEFIKTPTSTQNGTLEGNATSGNVSNEIDTLVDEEKSNKLRVTGLAVKDFFTNKKTLFWAGGIILVALIIFFIWKYRKKLKRFSSNITVRKLSEMKEERQEKIGDYKEVIEEAERKIKEAQSEINNLKNQGRIREMERKLKEDQTELRRLRSED